MPRPASTYRSVCRNKARRAKDLRYWRLLKVAVQRNHSIFIPYPQVKTNA